MLIYYFGGTGAPNIMNKDMVCKYSEENKWLHQLKKCAHGCKSGSEICGWLNWDIGER